MNDKIRKRLEEWVERNYKQYATGYSPQSSIGNYYDVFQDGYDCGRSWAAYEIGCLLFMDLEEPEEKEDYF